MTGGTSRSDQMGVRRDQWHPGNPGTVTGAADLRRGNMHDRLAGSGCSVVTTGAIRTCPGMGKGRWSPGCRGVTNVAGLRRRNMRTDRLGHCAGTGIAAVMARGTAARRRRRCIVQHRRRIEGQVISVAGVAGRGRRNVC